MHHNRSIIRLLVPAILIGLLCPLRLAIERTRIVEHYHKTEAIKEASNHRDVFLFSQPSLADDTDVTDVYAFVSPDRPDMVTIIADFVPYQSPAGGPNFFKFDDDVLYQIRFDNNGDARLDTIIEFQGLLSKASLKMLDYTFMSTRITEHLRNDGTVEKAAQTKASSSNFGWLGRKDNALSPSVFDADDITDKISFITVLLIFLIPAILLIGKGLSGSGFSYDENQQFRNPLLVPYLLRFLLLSDEEQESIIGDLFEEYSQFNSIIKAHIWLYRQILKSVLPLVFKNLKSRFASYFGERVR